MEVAPEDAETIVCFFHQVCNVVHFSEQSKSSSGEEDQHLVISLPQWSWLVRATAVVPSHLLAIKF